MNKKIFLISISLLIITYFIGNLIALQIFGGGKNLSLSILNNFSKKIITPQRGQIYDVNQNILANNTVSYNVSVDLSIYRLDEVENLLEKIRQEEGLRNYIVKNMVDGLEESDILDSGHNEKLVILEGLTKERYDDFFNKYGLVKGLIGYEKWDREYIYPSEFSNILGYLGEPDEKDIKEDDLLAQYKKIGKSGVEEFYNKFLIGQPGESVVYESLEGIYDELKIKNQKIGNSLFLTIDQNWQILLFNLLEKQMLKSDAYGAAGIIMESKTGEIKAMVSLPSFDANKFNKGITLEDYQELVNDSRKPLLNKVISTKISPGSTIKPILALFAFNRGIIDSSYKYYSKGCEDLGTSINFCEADRVALGEVDFAKSIYRSSNLYFCSIARLYDSQYGKQGLQFLLDDFDKLGSVDKTGIDIEGEIVSTLPSLERTQKNYGRDWSVGDMCNTFIGQGDMAVTPIKLLSYVSMLDNDGKLYQPRLVKQILDENNKIVLDNQPVERFNFEVKDISLFDLIKNAMKKTITDQNGSARLLNGLDNSLMVKTGSADAREVLDSGLVLEGAHSWVVGMFQKDGKSYAFVVVQFFGGRGFQTVPVIGNFINCLNNLDEKECIIY